MKEKPNEPDGRDLRKLAAEFSASRDPKAAIAALRSAVGPADFAALADVACSTLVYEARHEALRKLLSEGPISAPPANGSLRQPPRGTAAIDAAGDIIGRSILRLWTLPDGTPIGRATGAQLGEQAGRDEEIGRGVFVRAATFRALAAKAPGEKVVGEHVTDDEAWMIYREAERRFKAAGHEHVVTPGDIARRPGTNGHAGKNGKAKRTNGAGHEPAGTRADAARPVGSNR